MVTPVYVIAYRNAAFVVRRTAGAFWTAFLPHRPVSSGLGVSLALHALVFLLIGSALYPSGEDPEDIPELSVQMVTRPGPSSEELTDAALPQPAPDPEEPVIHDPGNGAQTLDAPLLADHPAAAAPIETGTLEIAPASVAAVEAVGTVLTTTGLTEHAVDLAEEALSEAPEADLPQREQNLLTRTVQRATQKLLDDNLTETEIQWQEAGQQYSARIRREPAADSTGLEQVIAEVTTLRDGKRLKTRLTLKRLAFSHFTQLVNHWDRNIMLHDDVIDGRFHSNTQFNFSSSGAAQPRFFGKVTTAASTLTFEGFNRRRSKEIFQGGYETRTDRVHLPRDMPEVVSGGDDADRRVFTADVRIIFNPDGSYVWRRADGAGPLHREEPSLRPRFLVGEKGVTLFVRGTITGIFTVYTPGDIEIEDDLVYGRDPRLMVLSRDFLALIAGRDVSIAPAQITGPGDLTINAAIFARRRFQVDFADRGRGDTLHIYGSLTSGTLSETEPRYATKIDYDKRFEYLRPAHFPMTRRYEVDSWDQDWEEVPAAGAGTGNLARSQ